MIRETTAQRRASGACARVGILTTERAQRGEAVERLQNSIDLAKASWNVLREDKQLTVLPLLSGVSALLVGLLFFGPVALIADNGAQGSSKPLAWILGAVGYLAVTYVVVFFNAALVWAADCRMRGEHVTVGEAVRAASERAHVLLPWAVLSATVSIVIRAIEERAGILGRIVGSLVGLAWGLVTFLVLPVLVIEQIGPIQAVKRSAELFKRTWGENMLANAGIGLVALVASMVGVVPCVLLIALGGPAAVVGVVLAVGWIIAVQLVAATLTGIFQTALYRFATTGSAPGFDDEQLRRAFRPRRSGGRWLSVLTPSPSGPRQHGQSAPCNRPLVRIIDMRRPRWRGRQDNKRRQVADMPPSYEVARAKSTSKFQRNASSFTSHYGLSNSRPRCSGRD